MTALFFLFIICFWWLFKRLKSFLHLGVAGCRERPIMRPHWPGISADTPPDQQGKSQNNGLTLQRESVVYATSSLP
ncbi:hypothetical protein, partial [Serratia symbiotica]|uniref:hypothetical protein n=1 Tax=Serratia symbiotica TaxID=138074 RepID=UPI003463D989